MDFHALPRRDLQALCKRNAIRANLSNAAMADALRSLPSVKGIDEIRTASAPPAMSAVKSAADEVAGEEQRHGCPLPRGDRSQVTTRQAAARMTERGAPVPETSEMTQNSEPRDATAPVEAEVVSQGKRRTRKSRKSKVTVALDQKEEAAAAEQNESLGMKLVEEVGGEELRHVCCRHGGRSQAVTNRATAHKAEEVALIPDTLQRNEQNTAAGDATVPVYVETFSMGKRRTKKSRRSMAKKVSDQHEDEAAAAQTEPTEPTLLEMKFAEEVGEEEPRQKCPLPRGGRSQAATKRATAHKAEEAAQILDTLQRNEQNTSAGDANAPVEAVSTGKRTRRSRRSKAKIVSDQKEEEAAAAQTEPTEPTLFEEKSMVEEEHHHRCPLPCGDRGRVTRSRAMAYKTEDATPAPDALQRTHKAAAQEAAAPVEMEEVSMGKRRTRRSRRSKVKMALDKKEEAAAAARKELIADSSDGTIGSVVVSDNNCNDCKEEKVSVVEVGTTDFQEGTVENQKPTSTVQKSPSFRSMKDSPIQYVLSMAETRGPVIEIAQDASVRDGGIFAESPEDEMAVKINPAPGDNKHHFSIPGKPDQSNLLVNTLDRFVKPMYKFPVKEETKQGECWWMLM